MHINTIDYDIKSVHLMLHMGIREKIKQRYLCICVYIHTYMYTNVFIIKQKGWTTLYLYCSIIRRNTHGHYSLYFWLVMWLQLVFIATFSHYPFCIPCAFSKHRSWSCLVLYLVGRPRRSFLKGTGHEQFCLGWAVIVFYFLVLEQKES